MKITKAGSEKRHVARPFEGFGSEFARATPRDDVTTPTGAKKYWTGAVPGVGGGTACEASYFKARERIAKDLGVPVQDLEIVEC